MGPHNFRIVDVKRAIRATREEGIKIGRIIITKSGIEIVPDDGKSAASDGDTPEDVKKLL
jgi:hypothetical protein